MSSLESMGRNLDESGPGAFRSWVQKMDSDPIHYQNLNKDPNLVINGSGPPGNWRIGDLFTSLESVGF